MKNNQGMSFYLKVVILLTVISFFSLIKNKVQSGETANEEIVLIEDDQN